MRALLLFAVAAILALPSCKKKTDDSPKAKLTGKWKNISYGIDLNSNGTLESDENFATADSIAQYYTFNSDGTGFVSQITSGATIDASITWTLTNNTDLQIHVTSSFYSDRDLTIQTLTSSDLIAKEANPIGGASSTVWWTFKKQ